jgi:hypothetical protein
MARITIISRYAVFLIEDSVNTPKITNGKPGFYELNNFNGIERDLWISSHES